MEVTLEGESIRNSLRRDSKRRTELLQSKSLKELRSWRPSLKVLPEGPRCGASTVTVSRLHSFINLEGTLNKGTFVPFYPPECEEDIMRSRIDRCGHPVTRKPEAGVTQRTRV